MTTTRAPLPLSAWLAALGQRWDYPGLDHELDVSESKRMTRSLGLCRPARAEIRLNKRLFQPDCAAVLYETLVHEAAHYVAYQRFGRRIKPHGEQWSALMRVAGFLPRTRIDASELPFAPPAVEHWLYEHVCTDCGQLIVRFRTSKRWRCKHCNEIGRGGFLKVISKQKVRRQRRQPEVDATCPSA